MHGVSWRLRETLSGRARSRFGLTHRKLATWLAAEGYAPTSPAADLAFLRDFWVAAFQRI